MPGSYDLVLMDVNMPVMDGSTAVRKSRQWEQHQQDHALTPIAALTASATEEDIRRSAEAGCTIHVSKPIKKARLLEAIRELTTSSRELAQ
jgi:CheY-like chemotaxis protein